MLDRNCGASLARRRRRIALKCWLGSSCSERAYFGGEGQGIATRESLEQSSDGSDLTISAQSFPAGCQIRCCSLVMSETSFRAVNPPLRHQPSGCALSGQSEKPRLWASRSGGTCAIPPGSSERAKAGASVSNCRRRSAGRCSMSHRFPSQPRPFRMLPIIGGPARPLTAAR